MINNLSATGSPVEIVAQRVFNPLYIYLDIVFWFFSVECWFLRKNI